jgi:hypothetical protein
VPVPGSDARLARRLEDLALPALAASSGRRLARCTCGGVPGPDGECEDCRRERLARSPAAGPRLARQGEHASHDDDLEDPGVLICTAFCFLGIPPSVFKDIVAAMLEAAYEHFHATDITTWRRQFDTYRQELSVYSKLRLLGKAFRFLMTGELGPGIVIRAARATAVRERIIAMLVRNGMRLAGLEAAEQIVRHVTLYIDLAIAAGCGTYCTASAAVRALLEVTDAASRGLSQALDILQGIGAAVTRLVSDVLANAYGQLDTANWRISSSLPSATRADVAALGLSLFAQVRPGGPWRQQQPGQSEADAFVANASRPISSLTTPYVQQTLLPSIATAIQRTLGGPSGRALDGGMLAAMSPIGLVGFMRDNGLLDFAEDPITYANRQLTPTQEPATAAP